MPLKSNRKVALSEEAKAHGQWTDLASVDFASDAPVALYLEGVPFALLVSRQVFRNEDNEDGEESIQYLATSDLSLSAAQMRAIYQKRWKVEEYHQSLKSHTSFSKSPTKRPRTQGNHFFSSLVAYVKLEVYRGVSGMNHAFLRSKLYHSALCSAYSTLKDIQKGMGDSQRVLGAA